METVQTEDRVRLRRGKTREAIGLALEGQWEKAIEINREILRIFPEDVDALNRLGKAFLEMGRCSSARSAFESAARIAPYNTISKKNLERLGHLKETPRPPKQGKLATPYLFIEESGKSSVTVLQKLAPPETLGSMAAGDAVRLEPRGHALAVVNEHGEYLGQVEPKLGIRLMRLMQGGNQYDAAIITIHRQEVSVIILETYRHPDMKSICSFPTKSRDDYRLYWADALLRYDLDSERDEEDKLATDWRESYSDGVDEQEPAESLFIGKGEQAGREADEE